MSADREKDREAVKEIFWVQEEEWLNSDSPVGHAGMQSFECTEFVSHVALNVAGCGANCPYQRSDFILKKKFRSQRTNTNPTLYISSVQSNQHGWWAWKEFSVMGLKKSDIDLSHFPLSFRISVTAEISKRNPSMVYLYCNSQDQNRDLIESTGDVTLI